MGAGRIVHHENLYSLVRRLKGKLEVAEAERRKAEFAPPPRTAGRRTPPGRTRLRRRRAPPGRMRLRRRRAPKGTRLQRRRAPPEGMQSWTWGTEYQELKRVADRIACYKDDIRYMTESINKLTTWMKECLAM